MKSLITNKDRVKKSSNRLNSSSNIHQAQKVLEQLYDLGVRDFVICPGGRNAPFVELLQNNKSDDIQVHWGFEERSAAFFGLGLSMKDRQPVAVLTTSGTAFSETTSALLEAHYTGLPLIVVSADRPQHQWGTGAPQTMNQKDFLIHHLGPSVDANSEMSSISMPLHMNCCFKEPLLDEDVKPWSFKINTKPKNRMIKLNPYKYKFKKYSYKKIQEILGLKNLQLSKPNSISKENSPLKPLFIISGLEFDFKSQIKNALQDLNADIYFESTGEISDLENQIHSKQISEMDIFNNYDFIVRVGGIPTHRLWRDIENTKFLKVLHFSALPLPGLSFGDVFSLDVFQNFLDDLKKIKINKNIKQVSNPNLSTEQKFFKNLKMMDKGTVFYLGNSLPIRNWDLTKNRHFENVFASRGLNGIDGQLSTALGLAIKFYESSKKVFAVLGDLTTLYDLSAPWYWKNNKAKLNFCLVVVNNSGGQIFSKMFSNPFFLNKHNINFKSFADMWNLSYLQINTSEEFLKLKDYPDVIEFKVES